MTDFEKFCEFLGVDPANLPSKKTKPMNQEALQLYRLMENFQEAGFTREEAFHLFMFFLGEGRKEIDE